MLWVCAGEFRGRSIKAFVRYAVSKAKQKAEDIVYRTYVTEALRIVTENTGKYAGGTYITKRFSDVISQDTEEVNGVEVAADVISRAGLVIR